MVVFKGLMSLVNPVGADPIKAAVKFYRDNDGKDTSGIYHKKAKNYLKSVKLGKKFVSDFANIIFPLCFSTTTDTVSRFSSHFKMTNDLQRKLKKDELTIFETYIDGRFETFISTDGTIKHGCPEELEAFCHYVYHQSRGELLIAGLKGVRSNNGKFRLTAPRIHSKKHKYGPDDCGEEAIFKFFLGHTCKESCNSNWRHPLSSPPKLEMGRLTRILTTNHHPGSMTPPPSYRSVLNLVCGNQCRRFKMGSNSVVVLPTNTRLNCLTGNEPNNNYACVSDAVSALQCG